MIQIHNYSFIAPLSYNSYFLQDIPYFRILDNSLKCSTCIKYKKL